jgi:hypothetical protein
MTCVTVIRARASPAPLRLYFYEEPNPLEGSYRAFEVLGGHVLDMVESRMRCVLHHTYSAQVAIVSSNVK